MHSAIQRVNVIDSHTEGEPTRVVIEGGPDLGSGPLAERRERFRDSHDTFRSAVVNEPRGSDVLVGALLCSSGRSDLRGRRDFFQQRRLPEHVRPRHHRADGHAGASGTHPARRTSHRNAGGRGHRLAASIGEVTIKNVPAYRLAQGVKIDVPGYGPLVGDIAWGGNWFFLVGDHGLELSMKNIDQLTDCTWKIRQTLTRHEKSPAQTAGRSITSNFSASHPARGRQQKFRALSGQGLRPLALRHRHQRQTRLPGGRRQTVRKARCGARKALSAACSRVM